MSRCVIAFVGLGSNLNNPCLQLRLALRALESLEDSKLLAHSRLYHSAPMGPADQPDYVNAVAALQTGLSPHGVLAALQGIERAQGRVRNPERHWGERVLDLDLLLYGDEMVEEADLVVPHPGLAQREFVVFPMLDVAADLVMEVEVPGLGLLHTLSDHLPARGLRPLSEEECPQLEASFLAESTPEPL